ncbi:MULTISPECIES: hypothetical protein [unclassified Lentimonas]|uniref:hypothetical protein n=1 Tax=unclassified Lentimonas TaxID=2630993 RepID=UPI0013214548|nr:MULTISPECIES: hypothetical protein [unclassified Lentimonas]CAA6676965.1 Unannotated [Lentimonas sp. CC4]CAA6686771.1 Unannotated [Lentimonas sp. CC6]CAA7075651.1 Unannotated [Lentimonas sp. CC4]CAA7168190.1 Unannotated [Lentimonas sp. CC21]CAA7181658.1 Unannotated [Lentimonas sp. CC8]
MKSSTLKLSALTSVLALSTLTANAGNSTLQPINTRFAQTQEAISIEVGASTFSDIELEEADSFDGWTAGAEVVVPFRFLSESLENMQVRLLIPFYTDGDAKGTDPELPESFGKSIDIDGNGGLYDFAIAQFEHQLFNLKDDDFNAAYYAGWGKVLESLDTTTSDKDLYNHSGKVTVGGIKYDRPISVFGNDSQLLLNAGFRHYYDTDDLHPDDEDSFTWADLRAAIVFEQMGEYIIPVLELTFLGDADYSDMQLQPEVIIPFNDNVSMKLGGYVGLLSDGSEYGGAASLAVGF